MESLQKTSGRLTNNSTNLKTKPLIQKPNTLPEKISLDKNQIIRGLVTDLRPGEVTIRLANKQTVTGQLDSTKEVSIGDVASFKIVDVNEGELTLVKLNSTLSAEENAIIRALEEANLPVTSQNQEIVRELLFYQKPINKESISYYIKLATTFHNSDIKTLMFLQNQGIPLSEEYLNHFSTFQNFDYRLLEQVKQIGDEFFSLLHSLSQTEKDSTLYPLMKQLFSNFHIEMNQDLPNLQEEMLVTVQPDQSSELLQLNPKEVKALIDLLRPYDIPEEFIERLSAKEAPLRDTIHYVTECISKASTESVEAVEAFKQPFILDLFQQFSSLQEHNHELASLLTTDARIELLNILSDLPLTISTAASIANGEITLPNFYHVLATNLTPEHMNSMRKLLANEEFHKLLHYELIKDCSLTPEDLNKEHAVKDYYESLLNKMKTLNDMANLTQNCDPSKLQEKNGALQDNIDFMKQFNQLFTYVQLPLKLKEQLTHGDLYVYTNKKALQKGSDEISVLLHLSLDHLGPLDIRITLQHTKVISKFYVPDKETKSLLLKQSDQLSHALQEKGFSCTNEFLLQSKQLDIIEEFAKKETPATPIKRYSFDIRA